MPLKEREKLFAVIGKRGFEKDLYPHDEVFDEIRQAPFTLREAEKIKCNRVGRNIVFSPDDLKAYKKARA
jgi:hypothetical protein